MLAKTRSIDQTCLFANNRCDDGALVFVESGSTVAIRNSILWGNGEPVMTVDDRSTIRVSDSCIEGGWPNGVRLLESDPMLEFVSGDKVLLSELTPCRDAGLAAHLPRDHADLDRDGDTNEPVPFDVRGLPRVSGRIDIGPFEWRTPSSTDSPGRAFYCVARHFSA